MVALVPDRDLGVVILWNSESSLPSGLMPTILDSAIGLAPHWLDDRTLGDSFYARRAQDDAAAAGSDSSTALSRPE